MIDVALTPAEMAPADIAVVIDVLRATSTVSQALAAGYQRVLCAESIERARALRGPGRLLAGERRCLPPPGFAHGNSPLEASQLRAEELVLATTNGAPAVVAATRWAPTVVLGCMLNLEAVIEVLRAARTGASASVLLVCSGTGGAPALEDTYVAGRLSAALPGPRSDTTRIAEAVARAHPTALEALAASANAQVLRSAGLGADIAHCAQESWLDVVPVVAGVADGVATVLAGGGARSEPAPVALAVRSTP